MVEGRLDRFDLGFGIDARVDLLVVRRLPLVGRAIQSGRVEREYDGGGAALLIVGAEAGLELRAAVGLDGLETGGGTSPPSAASSRWRALTPCPAVPRQRPNRRGTDEGELGETRTGRDGHIEGVYLDHVARVADGAVRTCPGQVALAPF